MMLPRTLLVLALSASSLAWGEPLDSPERIARLSYVEGRVEFQAAQESVLSSLPNRPLIPGDRLITKTGGRAELTLGTATVRLDEATEFSISTLDETTVRIELNRGTASVYLRELYDDETFEVVTPNTTLMLREPGEFRIAVPTDGFTDVTVRGGAADAVTAGGPVRIADGQRVRLEGSQALATLATPRSADAFDNWVLDREVQLADLEPSPEQFASGDEYAELNSYGEWYEESSYGRVWMPSYAYGGYDPFSYGHWQHYGTSFVWVNSMPWGYNTFHSGRWTYLNDLNRWCWVPERRHRRDHVADTRPIRLRRDDGRPSDHGKDRPPVASPSTNDDDREPVATTQGTPRRIDGNRVPMWRRDVESTKTSRSESSAPSVNPTPAAPARPAPAPQGGTTTMRPSRPVVSPKPATSSPAPATSRESGTIQPP